MHRIYVKREAFSLRLWKIYWKFIGRTKEKLLFHNEKVPVKKRENSSDYFFLSMVREL